MICANTRLPALCGTPVDTQLGQDAVCIEVTSLAPVRVEITMLNKYDRQTTIQTETTYLAKSLSIETHIKIPLKFNVDQSLRLSMLPLLIPYH